MAEELNNPIPAGEVSDPVAPEGGEPQLPEWLDQNFDSVEKQAQAYGDAKKQMQAKENEADYFRQLLEQVGVEFDPNTRQPYLKQPAGAAAPPAPEAEEEFDWENPTKSLKSMLSKQQEELKRSFQEMLGPVIGRVADSNTETVFQGIKAQLPDLPPEVEATARELVKQFKPEQKLDPLQVRMAYQVAYGDYMMNMAAGGIPAQPAARQTPGANRQVLGSLNMSQGRSTTTQNVNQLAAQEAQQAARWGMTPQEWAQHKAALEADGESLRTDRG